MMRISILKTALRSLSLVVALAITPLLFGQSLLTFDIEVTTPDNPGDIIIAEFKADNFTDIVSMQLSLNWNTDELTLISVQDFGLPILTASNFGLNTAMDGEMIVSWNSVSSSVSMPSCSTFFTIAFESVNGQPSSVEISNDPVFVEITDINLNLVLWSQSSIICNGIGDITGHIFRDDNSNCFFDLGEEGMQNWKIKFEDGTNIFYSSSDSNSDYTISLPGGTYDVSLILPNEDLWETCISTQTITVDSASSETLDFPVQAILNCHLMSVDISAPFLRRCFLSNYYVQYCNEGTITGEDAYIVIEFDPFLEVVSSSHPWTSVDGNTFTFDVGDVPSGECQTFSVEVMVDCDAVLGQTHCTSAHIYPDAPCVPTLQWDGSNLEITGTCDGDSVRFEIKNLGDDMANPVEFIVIEDDMIYLTSDPVLLLSQQSVNIAMQANGSTWRVEMPETPNNPFSTFTTEAIEGCGINGNGSFSLGFFTQFPQDDESLAIDEDCQENIGSFDPNDKTGYPKGFCQAHYIRSGQDIEYKIRFQNTGTDTAFNIVVTDTLSNFLSPASVRPGTSSHPYEFELLGEGVVKFSFPSIMLPDSNINEPGSHGFVKFTVSQQPNVAMGSVIENYAGIYFDFNEPVYTNIYKHTIGDDFVEMQGQVGDLSVSGTVRTWFDEPVENVEMTMTNLCPVFTDANGYYLIEDIDTAEYSLQAAKTSNSANENFTVLDMLKMRSVILFLTFPINPYQLWAADINGSGTVTTFDLVEYRKILLGISTNQQNLKWLFVRENYDPANPDGLPIGSYSYNPLDTDLDGQNFIAIQRGNIIDESMVDLSPINTQFFFEAESPVNGQIKVNVKANDFTKVNAFQFGLKWASNLLQFDSLEPGLLESIIPYWHYVPTPGEINMAYLQDGKTTATPNDILFSLVFNVLGNVGETTSLELDESNLILQVVVDTCKLATASVLPIEITIQAPNAVFDFENLDLQVKVAPNPVRKGQSIQLEVTTENVRSLYAELYDLSGSLVETKVFQNPAGRSQRALDKPLQKGIYFLKITSEGGEEMAAKVVVY